MWDDVIFWTMGLLAVLWVVGIARAWRERRRQR